MTHSYLVAISCFVIFKMSGKIPLFLRFLLLTIIGCYAADNLNKFVNHYETLNYTLNTRWKRATQPTETRTLTFTAFNKTFTMIFQQDTTTVSPETQFIGDSGTPIRGISHHMFVEGWLQGDEEDSKVHGILFDNGLFSGVFHSKEHGIYFIEPAPATYFQQPDNQFHSIIYNAKELINIEQYHYLVRRRNENVRTRYHRSTKCTLHQRKSLNISRNICLISLEADYKFREMAGGNLNALQLILHHVHALNILFRDNFNTSETYYPYGIRFHIGKVRIYNKKETQNLFGSQQLDARAFYDALIRRKISSTFWFCEAIFFTYTPFVRGIIGLASIRGVCLYHGYSSSSTDDNMVLVTLNSQNSRLANAITELVLAHEVAHSFGAKHDSFDDGFIMNAANVDGTKDNNYRFSLCSKNSMMDRIDQLRDSCLLSKKDLQNLGFLCGNNQLDEGEECDCGLEYFCQSTEPGNCCDYKTCKLKEHAVCSVQSNATCCDGRTCDYKKEGVACFNETGCQYSSYCLGNSAVCPKPHHKPDITTECRKNTSVCHRGGCNASICWKFGLERCYCKAENDQCKICCKYEGKCQVANSIPRLKSVETYLLPGDFCNDGVGFCDYFHRCLDADRTGAIKQWLSYYFTETGIRKLVRRYWWAWLIGTSIWICCVILLVKCLSLYTPSSNPLINAKYPARKLTIRFSKRSKSARIERDTTMKENAVWSRTRTTTV